MTQQATIARPITVVGLGEALFDCFPDCNILGGAPLNFTVHIQQLLGQRGHGVVVSRVGDDALGHEVIRQIQTRKIKSECVQVDSKRPTGTVQVTISPSGDPQYEISEDVAWDFIEFNDSLAELAANCNAVCFGTLAQRSQHSGNSIHQFLAAAPHAIRLLDVNLRQHYITAEILQTSLAAASAVKLNEEELARVAEVIPQSFGRASTTDDRARAMLNAFDLKLLALTRGPRGTVIYSGEGRYDTSPTQMPAAANADSVGAGDACSAGLIYGMLMQWPLEQTLDLANKMGAYVASQPGGTPLLHQSILDFANHNTAAS